MLAIATNIHNLVQARIFYLKKKFKKKSKFNISTQFKLVEFKVWTYKYFLLEIVIF